MYSPEWNVRLDDVLRARGCAVTFSLIARTGREAPDFAAAAVAFGELVANVVQHVAGPIRTCLEWSTCKPILHVADRGPGFVPRFERPVHPWSETGRGLFLAASLAGPLPVHRRGCRGACPG